MNSRLKAIFRPLVGVLLLLIAAPLVAAEHSNDSEANAGDDAGIDAYRSDELPWAFTFYTVWLSRDQLGDMLLFKAELEDSRVWVAALSRKVGSLGENTDVEVEGQIAKHGGPVQRHWEYNALGTLRWKKFPWNHRLGTTAAAGLGLSYAAEIPQFELDSKGRTNKWLAYILVELSFYLPEHPEWALVTRIHHRSSAYGTFENDIQGASNGAGIGIKYRF